MRYVLIAILFILLTACNTQKTPEIVQVSPDQPYDLCETDSDCICKGVYDGRCFIGNKDFYEKYVDKDMDCPVSDYCEGPYGNMVIKCIGKCVQMPK